MATFTQFGAEKVYIQGKVSWVKYIVPDPMYNRWSIQVHPNAEGIEKIRDLQTEGVKNQFKKDENGYFINFSRPIERKVKGRVIAMTPPLVLNTEGEPVEGLPIGNGSDGTVELEVYSHPTPSGSRAKAARWAGLKIDNLIPFNKDTDFPNPAMKEQAEGLNEQPQQVW